jgi:ketosteroid isomerase-like protein
MPEDIVAEREALIRSTWERWNAGEREGFDDVIAEDFVLDSELTRRTFRGREGLRDWIAEIDSHFDAWELHVDEFRPVTPDRYVAFGSIHLQGHGSGVELDQRVGWIIEFNSDGRVKLLATFLSHENAIAAAEQRGS